MHISDKLPCSTFCTFKSEPLSIFQNQLSVTVAGADIFSRSDAKISSWYKTALLLKFTIQAHSHVSLLFYCCFVNCDAFFDRTVSLSYWHQNICMQVLAQISVLTNSSGENILVHPSGMQRKSNEKIDMNNITRKWIWGQHQQEPTKIFVNHRFTDLDWKVGMVLLPTLALELTKQRHRGPK